MPSLDIPGLCGAEPTEGPLGMSAKDAVAHTRTFVQDKARDGRTLSKVAHITPILLGDLYPAITACRQLYWDYETQQGDPNEAQVEFSVPAIRYGFGPSLDKAIIAAIAVKHGASSMEAAAIARYALALMRHEDTDSEHGWK